jgi:hypothetical protein
MKQRGQWPICRSKIRKARNLKNRDFGLLIKLQEIQRITNLFDKKSGMIAENEAFAKKP